MLRLTLKNRDVILYLIIIVPLGEMISSEILFTIEPTTTPQIIRFGGFFFQAAHNDKSNETGFFVCLIR